MTDTLFAGRLAVAMTPLAVTLPGPALTVELSSAVTVSLSLENARAPATPTKRPPAPAKTMEFTAWPEPSSPALAATDRLFVVIVPPMALALTA